jgi:hypothetical protein
MKTIIFIVAIVISYFLLKKRRVIFKIPKRGHPMFSVGPILYYNDIKNGVGYLQMTGTMPNGVTHIEFSDARAIYKVTKAKEFSDFYSTCMSVNYKDVGLRRDNGVIVRRG